MPLQDTIDGWFHRPHWRFILSIGMAYGFSVFWLPLSRAIGITQPVAGRKPAPKQA